MPSPRSLSQFPRLSSRIAVLLLSWFAIACATAGTPPIESLRITVLSTNLADRGIGEWGYAALVEFDGRRVLFDTGHRPETVLNNARELKVDWAGVTDIVLSHHHIDHVGGLLTLRRAVVENHPESLSRVHLVRGAFWSRGPGPYQGDENPLIAIRPEYEASGGVFVEHAEPVELWPGVWLIGPVPRRHAEQKPVGNDHVHLPDGSFVPDPVPEDSALAFNTRHGLVVLTGCGHAGLVNSLEHARSVAGRPAAPIHAVTGGFHLHLANDGSLDWTARHLKALGVRHIHGGHCTGIETVYRLRRQLGLPREAVSVAAVGSWFDLAEGINPLSLAR